MGGKKFFHQEAADPPLRSIGLIRRNGEISSIREIESSEQDWLKALHIELRLIACEVCKKENINARAAKMTVSAKPNHNCG